MNLQFGEHYYNLARVIQFSGKLNSACCWFNSFVDNTMPSRKRLDQLKVATEARKQQCTERGNVDR